MVYCKSGEPKASGKISLACGIHCCPVPSLFFPPAKHLYTVKIYVYTHISDCIGIVYELPMLSNNTRETIYTNQKQCLCWQDIYQWGASLAVTGQIHDTGRKILQYSFQNGSSSSASYFHIFFLITFLEEAFIRNIIIILCINYIICINYNNAVLNSTYGRFQDLTVLFKIPMGTQNNFFEIYRQFGHMPSKRFSSPVLVQRQVVQSWR
jgi:hypothetical protein